MGGSRHGGEVDFVFPGILAIRGAFLTVVTEECVLTTYNFDDLPRELRTQYIVTLVAVTIAEGDRA